MKNERTGFNPNDTLPYTMHECLIDPEWLHDATPSHGTLPMKSMAVSTLHSGVPRKMPRGKKGVMSILKGSAVVYHYLRSAEDFETKIARGGGTGRLYYRGAGYRAFVENLVNRTRMNCTQVRVRSRSSPSDVGYSEQAHPLF